jgi:hypothetical protein
MRWASDKLQLDGVIKAAHLLGQASLDEVIEVLAAPGGAGSAANRAPQTRATISKA